MVCDPALPRPTPLAGQPGKVSLHGTAIGLEDKGLLIVGPSGAGKTGLAVELVALGAFLVADDLVIVERRDYELWARAPRDGMQRLELRGLGLVTLPEADPVPLSGAVLLQPSPTRLPEPETWTICETQLPLWRHPHRHDTAARLHLWLSAGLR